MKRDQSDDPGMLISGILGAGKFSAAEAVKSERQATCEVIIELA